jgi:hypothetical protein
VQAAHDNWEKQLLKPNFQHHQLLIVQQLQSYFLTGKSDGG